MLQLCCCIEAHLKENTAYFQVRTGLLPGQPQHPRGAPRSRRGCRAPSRVRLQGRSRVGTVLRGSRRNPLQPEAPGPRVTLLSSQFFSDVRETEEQLRKLQETLRRKYTCDRSATVMRLEDLLQDAQVRDHRPRPARSRQGRWPSPSGMEHPGGGSCGRGGGVGPPREPREAQSLCCSCFLRVPPGMGSSGRDRGAGRKTRRGSVSSAGRGRGGTRRLVLGPGVVAGWQLEQRELPAT